ncbi:MAG: hypothetical protein CMM01_23320 [Rhodopirellula sp.]|nr:hypothetical protein [Rhodopirellula sp.]
MKHDSWPVSCGSIHARLNSDPRTVELDGFWWSPTCKFPAHMLMLLFVGINHEKSFLHSGDNTFNFFGILFFTHDPAAGE